jgi:sterol desaturase/sphingolipid hydroxylase (fatty acid hydroxylase superfamily)
MVLDSGRLWEAGAGDDMQDFAMGLAAGLVGWTFLEYVIHAWLGHLPKGKILVSREHLHHHADITYFSSLATKLRGAVPVLGLLLAVAVGVGGWSLGGGFVLAVAIGWSIYEWLHEAIHVSGPRGPYTRWAARHHLHHHFSKPGRNHGVTTPLWDILLGTYEGSPQVRVPAKLVTALPWLDHGLQASTSPLYLADYVIAGRGATSDSGQAAK